MDGFVQKHLGTNMLYFTIGLPRSGKSTYCKEWSQQYPNRVIVSSDSIRLAITGKRYEPLAETLVFATKHIMIRSLLSLNYDVIVDGTHSTEISITRLLEIDKNAKYVIIPTRPEICIDRAYQTNQPDLVPTINRINKNLLSLGLNYTDPEVCIKNIDSFINTVLFKIKERNLYNECVLS